MNLRTAAILCAALVSLDRVTKLLVLRSMEVGESIVVIPGFFSLTHVRNPGAAFGFLAHAGAWREAFLIAVALAAVAGLAWLFARTPPAQVWERGAAAAVIAGALGNLYDRIADGAVVDFLDVYVGQWHWPAFNVADSCITIGVAILVFVSLRGQPAEHERPAVN